MKQKMKRLISAACTFIMLLTLLSPSVTEDSYAEESSQDDKLIVVSLGDSYSSGEGITPFYGQEKSNAAKIYDNDWLAHRSQKSWPGLLTFSEIQGHTLKEYKNDEVHSNKCEWYFQAASGAKTYNVVTMQQLKEVTFPHIGIAESHKPYLPVQLEVFNSIDREKVDYVTLTIGGNDVNFVDIITDCVIGSSYLHYNGAYNGSNKSLTERMSALWDNIETTKANISDVYKAIAKKAPNAEIIVAGYPELLDYDGKGAAISKEEATYVNLNVRNFNELLNTLVSNCQNDISIHFVDVVEEFKGHQAYSGDAWIKEIKWGPQSQDLKAGMVSEYSMHPDENGAIAYAKCVNKTIKEIEKAKKERLERTITGSVIDTKERPLDGVKIKITDSQGASYYADNRTDQNGLFAVEVPEKNRIYSLSFEKKFYSSTSVDNIFVTGKTDIGTVMLGDQEIPDTPPPDSPDPSDEKGNPITDSWEEIISAVNDGTYYSKYKIGDTKELDLGTEGIVEMQIAAFDADELADGSGKAAITWISKQLLNSDHPMNPELEADPSGEYKYKMGTGPIGGWENSEMRTWLKSDIKPLIPSAVRNAIKPVTKYSLSYDISCNYINNAVTVDDVWIPSYRELVGEPGFGYTRSYTEDGEVIYYQTDYYETEGPIYNGLFVSEDDRIKQNSDKVNISWWLRSASHAGINASSGPAYFRCVSSGGGCPHCSADFSLGVALGFCM